MKLIENAKSLKEELAKTVDFFIPKTIVFDNLTIEQWFKAYWLKNNDDLYMNIKSIRFDDLFKSAYGVSKLLDDNITKKLLIDILLGLPKYKSIDYIFDDALINPIRLYDYAKQMASLFINYEDDLLEIDDSFQKELYEKVLDKGRNEGYFSRRNLLKEEVTEKVAEYNNTFVFVTRELTNLEKELLNKLKLDKNHIYELTGEESKPEVKIIPTPSTLREIEVLHSNICKLIKVDKDGKSIAKPNEIVVYAPDTSEYEADIIRVFKQSDSTYPNVPYVLSSTDEAYELDVIKIIKEIISKGYCTRKTFINLVENEVVTNTFRLSLHDINVIRKAIVDSNTYRNNDWQYLKERILLSKLVGNDDIYENITELNGTEIIPFYDMSLDDDLICKLINIIDIVIRTTNIKPTDKLKDKYNELNDILGKLLNYEEATPSTRNVRREIRLYESMGDLTIDSLLYDLSDLDESMVTKGTPFTDGVTFLSMQSKRVVSAMHTFIIGMSSNNYPRKEIKSEFDLNKDRSITKEDRDTFKRILNNSDNVVISYVNKNQKSDEEYFLSSVVRELGVKEEPAISLDETRPYEELFTKREEKNKNYYKALVKGSSTLTSTTTEYKPQPLPLKLSFSKLKEFLKEPLKEKANLLFGWDDDEILEDIGEQYEPLAISSLDNAILESEMIKYMFDGKDIDAIKKIYQLRRQISDYGFENKSDFEESLDRVNYLYKQTKQSDAGYEIRSLKELKLSFVVGEVLKFFEEAEKEALSENPYHDAAPLDPDLPFDSEDYFTKEELEELKEKFIEGPVKDEKETESEQVDKNTIISWTLMGNKQVIVKEDGDSITYVCDRVVKRKQDFKELFLFSLVDIASRDEREYSVNYLLYYYEDNNKFKELNGGPIIIQPSNSKVHLNAMYYLLNDMKENICVVKKEIESIYDLFKANKDWMYFKNKDMFGPDELVSGKNITKEDIEKKFGDIYGKYKNKYHALTKLLGD